MSNLPLSLVLAVRIDIVSSSSGWRTGSFSMQYATSSSRLAVISLTSLWCMMTYPPLGQLRAWSTLFGFPHTQTMGMALDLHPYLKASASQKSLLWIAKPCSSIGSVASHADALFSCARDMALFDVVFRVLLIVLGLLLLF